MRVLYTSVLLAIIGLFALTVDADNKLWRLADINWPGLADSVRLNVYADGVLSGTEVKANVQSWDTVLTAIDGKLNLACYNIYYAEQAQPSVWVHQRNLKRGQTGGFAWRLADAYFPTDVDSAKLKVYRDTVLVFTGSRVAGTLSYDTTLTAYAQEYNTANLVLWYAGYDSAATWSWVWDMTDTSTGVALPGTPAVCRVEGTLFRADGSKVEGAIVTAVRVAGENATGSSNGVNIIVTGLPTYAVSDTSGYFSMFLVGTHEYADTTRGFYNIRAEHNGQELFNLVQVWMPSGDIWNIADTINARRR